MTDTGDALPLIGRGGTHHGTRAAEQHLFQLAGGKVGQNASAQHRRRTAAPRTAGVDILTLVIQQHAAVLIAVSQLHAVPAEQFPHHSVADGGQIVGDIKIDLPRTRDRSSKEYEGYVFQLTNLLREAFKGAVVK